jgi:hypothetical protein
MVVGPRRSDGRPRGKGHFGVGVMVQRPKWMTHVEALNAASYVNSPTEEVPPSYAESDREINSRGLHNLITSFDPHEFDLHELLKRFLVKRSGEKESRTLSPKYADKGKPHTASGAAIKE